MFAKDMIPSDHKPSRSRKFYSFHDNHDNQHHGTPSPDHPNREPPHASSYTLHPLPFSSPSFYPLSHIPNHPLPFLHFWFPSCFPGLCGNLMLDTTNFL